MAPDPETVAEVEDKLGRPFQEVKAQLKDLFGEEWDEIEVLIETSAAKRDRSRAEVIVDLVARVEARPAPRARMRKALIRWIGKPWRERANPWDHFKDRLPPVPPPTRTSPDDLEEWVPRQPDED